MIIVWLKEVTSTVINEAVARYISNLISHIKYLLHR